MPIQAFRKIPFMPLPKLSPHKEQLFAWMTPHIAIERPRVGELLPEVARHLVNHRAFEINYLVMGKRQHEVFGVSIHEREGDIVMVKASINGVLMHILEHIMHPTH